MLAGQIDILIDRNKQWETLECWHLIDLRTVSSLPFNYVKAKLVLLISFER